jgi:uncharacterized membrane protein YkoI
LLVAVCFSLCACGRISKSKAIDIALAELKLNKTTTPREEAILDESSNPPVYKVIIYLSDENKVVMINADSGEVLSVTSEDANRK